MKLSRFIIGARNSDIREWTNYINDRKAINLAQGICHIEPSEEKRRAVEVAYDMLRRGLTQAGYNSYSHYTGVPKLRQVIASKAREYNGIEANPDTDVLITDGASGAFNCAISSLTEPGDEVILFEPFYTYHMFLLKINGIQPRTVKLKPPAWAFTFADLEAVFSERTRAVVINTPANPSGKVFSADELRVIARFCESHDIAAVTDEVYEFMVFDGSEHVSLARMPGMWQRTVTIGSFSKPLGITGWRVGYTIAPKELSRAMGYFNEYAYVCAPTPLQHAIAEVFDDWRRFKELGNIYQHKRDILCDALRDAGFPFHEPKGAFYVLVDVSKLGLEDDVAANKRLIENPKIGGVPAHDFYTDDTGKHEIRFCFAVEDALLHEAAKLLRSI